MNRLLEAIADLIDRTEPDAAWAVLFGFTLVGIGTLAGLTALLTGH